MRGSSIALQPDYNKIIPSMDYRQADVREALRALFRLVNGSYTAASDVQGTVTLSLKNVTFETALQNLTRQIDATYHIEGGVYQIIHRIEMTAPALDFGDSIAPKASLIIRRIKIRSADPALIAMLISQMGANSSFSSIPERTTMTNAAMFGGGSGGSGGRGGFGSGSSGGGGSGGSGCSIK
jgi:type II secretory pathway component GspD/PulD (secretin)